MTLAARFRMGKRIHFTLQHTLFPQGITSPAISYKFYRNDLDIYSRGTRAYNIKYRQHRVELLPINSHFRRYRILGGLRFDYFHFSDPLLSAVPTTVTLQNDHYFSYFLSAYMNTEDHWYFPTKGARFHFAYAYRTSDLVSLHGEPGLNDILLHWRLTIPLSQKLTLQPMTYGRILTSEEPPLAFRNFAGGEWFGFFVEQQLPFAGLGHIELMQRHFAAAQLQLQYRMGKNHYLLFRASAAYNTDDLATLTPEPNFYGLQLGYSYNSIMGPLNLRVGYTTLSEKLYLLVSMGHQF
jgi:NTE family protein